MRICLFLPTPRHTSNVPVAETASARMRRRLRRSVDRIVWRFSPARHLSNYAWTDLVNSNKGDHAIRMAIGAQIAAAMAPQPVTFTEVGWDDMTPDDAEAIGRSHDLFVIAGSGYFTLGPHGQATPRLLRDCESLERLRCPAVAYGTGTNRNFDAAGHDPGPADDVSSTGNIALARLLGRLGAVGVRDANTQQALQRLTDRPVELMGDPVLFWPEAPPAVARPLGQRLRIGVNLAYHGAAMDARMARNLPVYAAFLRRLAAELSAELHYIVHYDAERAVPPMLRSHGVTLAVHDVPAAGLAPVYRTLDLHVCEMLHSSIIAIAAGVPTMNIGYDVKNRAFFELLGSSGSASMPRSSPSHRCGRPPRRCWPGGRTSSPPPPPAPPGWHARATGCSAGSGTSPWPAVWPPSPPAQPRTDAPGPARGLAWRRAVPVTTPRTPTPCDRAGARGTAWSDRAVARRHAGTVCW